MTAPFTTASHHCRLLGLQLKAYRERHAVKITTAASKAGISMEMARHIEAGNDCSMSWVVRYADALGMSLSLSPAGGGQ